MERAQLGDVIGGHLGNAQVARREAVQTARLETVDRLVEAEVRDEVGEVADELVLVGMAPPTRKKGRRVPWGCMGTTRNARQPRCNSGNGRALVELDGLRQAGDGRLDEQAAQRQVDLERGPQEGDQAGGAERMAAEGEEIVVDADAFDAEDLGPRSGDRALDGAARRDEGGVAAGGDAGRVGQRPAVDLAVGVSGRLGSDT